MRLAPLPLLRFVIRRDVITLCYHLIAPTAPPHVRHVLPVKSPEAFDADMAYLRAHHEIIDYPEALRRRRAGRVTSHPPVLVTFDDGFREWVPYVLPILAKYEIRAVFFLTTSFLDNGAMFYRHKTSLCIEALRASPDVAVRRLERLHGSAASVTSAERWLRSLTFEQEAILDEACSALGINVAEYLPARAPYVTTSDVTALREAGHTIGAHGVTHRRLTPDTSVEILRHEITASCRAIAELTGRSSVPFAFPFSADGLDRQLLANLQSTHPEIEMYFDRRELRRDAPCILQRILADRVPSARQRSVLPHLLNSTYQMAASARLGALV